MTYPRPLIGDRNYRGRGEPIRLLLKYVGQEYDERRYDIGHIGATKSEWLDNKYTLGLDFPTLPYLIEGDLKLTQTLAILRHFARRFKLNGATDAEKDRIAMLEQQIIDLLFSFLKFVHKRSDDDEREKFFTQLAADLEQVSKFLGSGKFALGDQISYVDFVLYDYLFWLNYKDSTAQVLAHNEGLAQYVERFEAIPQFAEYIKSIKPKH